MLFVLSLISSIQERAYTQKCRWRLLVMVHISIQEDSAPVFSDGFTLLWWVIKQSEFNNWSSGSSLLIFLYLLLGRAVLGTGWLCDWLHHGTELTLLAYSAILHWFHHLWSWFSLHLNQTLVNLWGTWNEIVAAFGHMKIYYLETPSPHPPPPQKRGFHVKFCNFWFKIINGQHM